MWPAPLFTLTLIPPGTFLYKRIQTKNIHSVKTNPSWLLTAQIEETITYLCDSIDGSDSSDSNDSSNSSTSSDRSATSESSNTCDNNDKYNKKYNKFFKKTLQLV